MIMATSIGNCTIEPLEFGEIDSSQADNDADCCIGIRFEDAYHSRSGQVNCSFSIPDTLNVPTTKLIIAVMEMRMIPESSCWIGRGK
jgi:hypothetical protein